MRKEFLKYLNLPYNYCNGPDAISSMSHILERGLNCQALVHLIYQHFGLNLPKELLSAEVFADEDLFQSLPWDDPEQLQALDIFLFGGENDDFDTKKLHLAVYTGEQDEEANPLLIHANSVEQKISIWPLKEFQQHWRYRKIYGLRRLRHLYIGQNL